MLEDALIRLLDYDRRVFWLENGWSLRFRVARAARTAGRPHGIKYSLTLHGMTGERLLGFDNAHAMPRIVMWDHTHRFRRTDVLEPYQFESADNLISDFFAFVERACEREGVDFAFVDEGISLEDDDETDEST